MIKSEFATLVWHRRRKYYDMREDGRPKKSVAALVAHLPLAVGDGSAGRKERRVLTGLSYDIVGSTDLLVLLDIEDFQELMSAFQRSARHAITACGGVVRAELGDGGVALFPPEIDAKDAASFAIRAGLEIVKACGRVGQEKGRPDLHVRVGIATSITLLEEGQTNLASGNIIGAPLAMAMRLQAIAKPDTVLVSHQTRNLARRSHVFSFQCQQILKGFAEPERIWRAISHRREVGRFFAFGLLSSPLVDRADELRTITECWNNAIGGKGEVLLIEGEAGIGKSRLLYELRKLMRLRRAKLLFFQCQPGGSRSSLHPLLQLFPGGMVDSGGRPPASAVAELLKNQGIFDVDAIEIFCFLLGAEGGDRTLRDADLETIREKANWAAGHCLETMCARGTLVLVVEDIHWIDPTSRQLLAEIARLVHRHPVFLILTTRPKSAGWLEAPNLRHMSLEPLDREDTRLAIADMWPESKSSALPELLDVMERVTGGVPLFIEEICRWMAENAESATERLAQAVSPNNPSVFESILEARLEALGPARDIARAAAVAGNRFNLPLLCHLLPDFNKETIAHALEALCEAGFVTRVRYSGLSAYGFRHALIQETIYNALLRRTRQAFHRRLFAAVSQNRDVAAWVETAVLAEHAERAGLQESAIELLVKAGRESSARSAMVEARNLLEHALALCDQITEPGVQDTQRLSALAALGPILIATEGPSSLPARKLYEDGLEIARRRPMAERAKWFPIYWGWWFTGADVGGERAHAVLNELKDVQDDEVQLQIRHCVWAIDFYLARHDSCIAAVDTGLPLYGAGHGRENVTLFGGHDARVCGLSHSGLSQWFAGRATSAFQSLREARRWALQIGHVGSIAHAYYNEAMLACYRRDFAALGAVIADIRHLMESHRLPSLGASAQIFAGWCEANAGDVDRGRDMIRQGLAIHESLQTPEDYPVYCGMLAEVMTQTGEIDEALELLSSAFAEAEQSGHRYWLSELNRRRARLLFHRGAPQNDILGALADSLAIAVDQNAVPILLCAYEALVSLGLSPDLAARYSDRVEQAKNNLEPGEALIVNPEPIPWTRPAR